MAVEMIGLLWAAIGPETLAASCRASLAVGYPGLLMAAAPFDQAAEIAARLDDIWQAAQDDPSVALVELPSPLLQRVIPESHAGRPRRVLADQPVDVAEPSEAAPEGHPGDAELIPEPVAAEGKLDVWGFPVDTQAVELENTNIPRRGYSLSLQDIDTMAEGGALPAPLPPAPEPEPAPPEPENAPEPPPIPLPDTTGWFSAADAAELLGLSMGAIARRRRFGQLGQQGVDWLPAGRSIVINPAFIEQLMEPPGNGVPETHGISAELSENGSHQLELVAETQS